MLLTRALERACGRQTVLTLRADRDTLIERFRIISWIKLRRARVCRACNVSALRA